MDITDFPAHALSSAILKRQVSCREVMRATLARIESVNPVHNAIVSLRDGDVLLHEADERDGQLKRGTTPAGPIGWMHGMPQAIKDMAQTAGIRTTLGSPLLRDFDAALRWPNNIAGREIDTYHRWMEVVIYATLAGLPCISIPVGFNSTGLPMGMQLIGRPRGDLAVLQLAHAYEKTARDVLAIRPRA